MLLFVYLFVYVFVFQSEPIIEDKDLEEAEEREEELPDVSLWRIFSINQKWWWLMALGAAGAMFNGAMFPIFAIIFGEVLEVFSRPSDEVLDGTHLWAGLFLALGTGAAIGILLKVN